MTTLRKKNTNQTAQTSQGAQPPKVEKWNPAAAVKAKQAAVKAAPVNARKAFGNLFNN